MANRMWVLVVAGATAFAARGAAAKCAMTELVPSLLTAKAATVPGDGGVLIGYTNEVGRSPGDSDPSVVDWKFSVAVDHVTLAPGLTVYHPKTGAKVAIADAKGKALASYTLDAKATATALPAPMPQSLSMATFRSGRGTRREMTATLSVPPPSTAVAVILYSSKAGKPISYGRVTPSAGGGKAVVPWADPARCAFNPAGMTAPDPGDTLVLAWVDQFGRIGKSSAPIAWTVGKTTGSDDD